MADPLGSASNSDNLINNLLAASFANQADNDAQQTSDNAADDAQQAALLKKIQAKQAQQRQQAKAHESFNRDTHAHQRFLDATGGKMGPSMQAWANNQQLQKKLSSKQKELFLNEASRDGVKGKKAADAITELTGNHEALLGAEVSRQTLNEVHDAIAKNPGVKQNVSDALDSKIMRDPRGDRTTKQEFLRLATRPNMPGVSIRRGGDMLGTLSGREMPGFAQQAGVKMLGRNPNNIEGVDTVDNFAQVQEIDQMPRMAKGRATESLARADGARDVADGFVTVARDPKFKRLDSNQKAELFNVIGGGRTSDLRAITDQTLGALRSKSFPTQKAQTGAFLSHLQSQITRAKERGDSKLDTQGAMAAAKRGAMPRLPALRSTEGLTDEEARGVRMQNRAKVMSFYTQLGKHYDDLDKKMSAAKYRQEVHIGVMVKQPEKLNLEAFDVRPEAKSDIDSHLADLRGQYDNKTIRSRSDYVKKLNEYLTTSTARSDLSMDEQSYLSASVHGAVSEMNYLDLSSRKNRRMRELTDSLAPPAEYRKRAASRRTSGVQPRYFRARQNGQARGVRTLPLPGGARSATSQTSNERWTRATAGAGGAQLAAGPSGGAAPLPGRTGRLRAVENFQARVQNLESKLSPTLSPQERQQKLSEMVVSEMQHHLEAMASEMVATAMQTLGRGRTQQAGSASMQPIEPVGRQSRSSGAAARGMQGKTNSWGIQRTWERDLGAGHDVQAVRAPRAQPAASDDGAGEVLSTRGRGEVLKPTTEIRSAETVYQSGWREMSSGEQAVMRNLGWDAQRWEARNSAGASWPTSYTQSFEQLRPIQRSSVRALGLSADDWDRSAGALAEYADDDTA